MCYIGIRPLRNHSGVPGDTQTSKEDRCQPNDVYCETITITCYWTDAGLSELSDQKFTLCEREQYYQLSCCTDRQHVAVSWQSLMHATDAVI